MSRLSQNAADTNSPDEDPNKKQRESSKVLVAVMFVLQLVLLASLAIPHVLSDSPTYVNDRWRTDVENHQYDDADDDDVDVDDEDDSPLLQENMLPENSTETAGPLTVEDQNLQTTPESDLLLGEDPNEVHDSQVWKIVLVTVVLLTSLVGSLGTAYYMCVWRGGRIHYQPQRTYA